MAQYVEVQRLLEEVAVVEARLSPNERELYRSLKAKYAEPLSIAFDDKVCLEVLLRNVEVRRGLPGQLDFRIDDSINWSASILIVALPVFFFMTRKTNRAIERDPSRRASDMRRRLTYLTLAVSAFVLLGVFSTIVYSFLDNALTWRFVLKALSAGLIATGVFWYYLKDVQEGSES